MQKILVFKCKEILGRRVLHVQIILHFILKLGSRLNHYKSTTIVNPLNERSNSYQQIMIEVELYGEFTCLDLSFNNIWVNYYYSL